MTPRFSIAVYCGSRLGISRLYSDLAEATGNWIGQHGGQLVFGGGKSGLMGVVADATLKAGGRVVGVIPKALVERECAHQGCTELHVVANMHDRKRLMAERADAFVALPGGIGTMEEFFEMWTWHQLGYHNKPVGLLNAAGYYDSLLAFLATSVTQGFMQDAQMNVIRTGPDPLRLLPNLVQAAGLSSATGLQWI